MFDAHLMQIHVVLMCVLIILQLGLESVEGVLQNSTSLRVRLLVDSVVLLWLDVVAVENVFDDFRF